MDELVSRPALACVAQAQDRDLRRIAFEDDRLVQADDGGARRSAAAQEGRAFAEIHRAAADPHRLSGVAAADAHTVADAKLAAEQRCDERIQCGFSSQSFWKAGSARKGSHVGSSLRSSGVTGP